MRLSHAEHNEALCNLILKDGNFNDWAITTAFYAALHFAQHKIFPFKQGRKVFKDLNHYYFQHLVKSGKRISKHQTMIGLVRSSLPKSYSSYRWLLDASQTARYNDYRVSKEKAFKSWERMQLVKNEVCSST